PSLIPGAVPRSMQTYEAALAALDQDQVVAILADNVILHGLIAQRPGRYRLVGGLLTSEPYAAAVAFCHPRFFDLGNVAIQQFKDSGGWAASYRRYFPGQAVPDIPTARTQLLSALQGRDSVQESIMRLGIRNGIMAFSQPLESGSLLKQIRERGYLKV